MPDEIEQSVSQTIACFETRLATQWSWPSAEAGLALHAYLSTGIQVHFIPTNDLKRELGDRRSEAPVLAAYGYAIYNNLIDDQEIINEWKSGLARISKKQIIVESRSTFGYRPVELLGITLGALKIQEESNDTLNWLINSIKELEKVYLDYDEWSRMLAGLVAFLLKKSWDIQFSISNTAENLSVAALRCWLILAFPDYAKKIGLSSVSEHSERMILALSTTTSAVQQVEGLGTIAVVNVALIDVTSRIMESAVDRYYDSSLQDIKRSYEEQITLLSKRSDHVIKRSIKIGRFWMWFCRLLLSPLVVVTAAASFIALYRLLEEVEIPNEYSPIVLVALFSLILYRVFADWQNSPVKKVSDKFGLWVANRSISRWQGNAMDKIKSLDADEL